MPSLSVSLCIGFFKFVWESMRAIHWSTHGVPRIMAW